MNIFVNDHFQNKEEKQYFFHSLMTSLTSYFPGSDFYLGISKRTQSILGAKHAYKQAIGAIRMITSKTKVIYYDSLGVIGALLNEKNEEEVRNMAKSLLGHLELDCQKSIELITTLYSFLINGGIWKKQRKSFLCRLVVCDIGFIKLKRSFKRISVIPLLAVNYY